MINPPDNPARLLLPADWRVLGFGLSLALGVTVLFGLARALRASTINPVSALKGGEDPHSRKRLMHALIGAQVPAVWKFAGRYYHSIQIKNVANTGQHRFGVFGAGLSPICATECATARKLCNRCGRWFLNRQFNRQVAARQRSPPKMFLEPEMTSLR
jgi:hypothetical protein